MEQVFQLDRESQQALNEAMTKVEFFALYKEYVVTQIMLKHKDKQLRFDPQNKMFFETMPEILTNAPGSGEEKEDPQQKLKLVDADS